MPQMNFPNQNKKKKYSENVEILYKLSHGMEFPLNRRIFDTLI